jgi:hypothetical protein
MFNTMLVMDDPKIVKLLSGMAYFGWNPYTIMSNGTKMPPPPTPPDAAIIKPKPTRAVPHKSEWSNGNRSLCPDNEDAEDDDDDDDDDNDGVGPEPRRVRSACMIAPCHAGDR